MNNPTAWLLFVLFALILFAMYVAIRRRWAPTAVTAAVGVAASVIVMTLNGLAQNNGIYQALFSGLLVGGLFSGGTLAIAYYFQISEQRRLAELDAYDPPEDGE